jgi:hypothetical protein
MDSLLRSARGPTALTTMRLATAACQRCELAILRDCEVLSPGAASSESTAADIGVRLASRF